jgi:hypothetical protein
MCLFVGGRMVTLVAEFSHGVGDRIIETAVQCPKLGNLKWSIALVRKVRDRLAKIPTVVDDLIHRESKSKQFVAVQRGRRPRFRQRGRAP